MYGSKKASNKPADKWLALSVDHLLQKYPALRIAYIDTAPSLTARGKGTPMSVLLRWNSEEEVVEECYRVRLPDQVEDGRGVVCTAFGDYRAYFLLFASISSSPQSNFITLG